MRRIDVAHAFAAEVDDLSVRELARAPIAKIVERDHTADHAVRDLGVRRLRKELVHRSALVRLDVTERDEAQARDRDDPRDRRRHERKHTPRTRMEKQWLIGADQELVEGETARRCVRHQRGEPEDAVSDLVRTRFHGRSFSRGRRSRAWRGSTLHE